MTEQRAVILGQAALELCEILDEQAESIRQTLRRLDSLRGAVVQRNEKLLRELAEQVDAAGLYREESDLRRVALCRRLGALLGCGADAVNVTAVCEILDSKGRSELEGRRRVVRELAERLRIERNGTELLLRECARMNRAILSEVIGQGRGLTYTRRGAALSEMDGMMMSVKL